MVREQNKTAIVGIGYWGSTLLRNLVAIHGVSNVVAVDLDLNLLTSAYTEYPGLRTHRSLDEALADESITNVVVATPAASHFRLARQALEAGRHVYVEKPLASNSVEAEELCRIADACGRHLMVGHLMLFSPRVDKMRELVSSGQIGEVSHMSTQRLSLGRFRPDANVIWDLAPHDFSVIFHVLGEFPTKIQTAARADNGGDHPYVAFCNLWFPSGALANVTVSWLAPRKVRNMVVVGQDRMLQFDDAAAEEPVKIFDMGVENGEQGAAVEPTYRQGDIISPHVGSDQPVARQLRHFRDASMDLHPMISDGRFGVSVVKALEAADLSWRSGGEPIEFAVEPPAIASI